MKENPELGSQENSRGKMPASESHPSHSLWLAGIRYSGGTKIWCAYRSGEPAWTTDRKFAARYQSQTSAVMAAQNLTDGDAEPFWTKNDS